MGEPLVWVHIKCVKDKSTARMEDSGDKVIQGTIRHTFRGQGCGVERVADWKQKKGEDREVDNSESGHRRGNGSDGGSAQLGLQMGTSIGSGSNQTWSAKGGN